MISIESSGSSTSTLDNSSNQNLYNAVWLFSTYEVSMKGKLVLEHYTKSCFWCKE
jgi:hypothetical protein